MNDKPQTALPRRTRDRILAAALRLCNELGEPAVTTTSLADYLRISPGNLYYHFRNKDDIVNSIFAQFEAEMDRRLSLPADHQPGLEEVWTYLQKTADFLWRYRFLYRDINDLLARNRMLETRFRGIVERKRKLAMEMCQLLAARGEFTATPQQAATLCTNIAVLGTYWLSYQYVLRPRQLNDHEAIRRDLHAGCLHILSLLAPYLRGSSQAAYERLAQAYLHQQQEK
ncbi:MAG: TetR/AcrR family transcriptional regulator [Candidatus Protistobacter heckmanni]|nr:TetR/AcrR family transcriptional regulator [Candidatus Protistobacter heckmanni]